MPHRLALALLVCCASHALVTAQSDDRPVVIRAVRVFDGEAVAEGQTVVIRGGRIDAVGAVGTIAVPPEADELTGEGRTLLPGLIDAHVHVSPLWPVEALQQALAFGVTTVLDMWTGPPPAGWTGTPALRRLKELEASDRADVAAVRTAGTGATAPGGHPTQMDGGWAANVVPTIAVATDADGFVAARLAEGSDFIKIIYDDAKDAYGLNLPTVGEPTMAALVTAAHARRRVVVAHIGSERHARGAMTAGVDGLAHLFVAGSVSADFGRFAASRGVFVIPTLSVLYHLCGKSDGPAISDDGDAQRYIRQEFRGTLAVPPPQPARSCEGTLQAVRQLAAAGVRLLAGTDSPGPGTAYGASLHRELEHLVNAGMMPTAALAAATSVPADAFRLNDRGRIRAGMRADVILVEGDPSTEIRASRNIVGIWKRGVRLQLTP